MKKPGLRRAFSLPLLKPFLLTRILDLQLGTTIARTAFLGLVGVDRVRFAEALDRRDTTGINTMRGQVFVNDLRTTLGQLLVVRVGTDRVGVTVEFNLDVRVAVQRVNCLVKDRDRIRGRNLQ